MEYFYDGQIRRYITQFMRIFIGFKYQAGDGTHTPVPVMYGDMTRQVAAIIRENSENKMPSVPKMACYITGLELDRTRLADATFVSKMNIHERNFVPSTSGGSYTSGAGQAYTVERLMPTPFKLTMKCDLWTSNTDQKLQLLEQILVLFNPSLEIQTTDNYIDWTSLSVVDLKTMNFSSRTIPAGTESDIDICSLEFEMPIYITPPAKVKRLGVVRDVVMNVFDANGDTGSLNSLIYNGGTSQTLFTNHNNPGDYGVLLLSANDPAHPEWFNVSVLNPQEAVLELNLQAPIKQGQRLDWNLVLSQYSGHHIDGISLIHFMQPSGYEISGTFVINPLDPTYLVATLDLDTIPTSENSLGVNAIINPLTFNPRPNLNALPVDGATSRYLLIDDIGAGVDKTYIATTITTIIDTGVEYGAVFDDEFVNTDNNINDDIDLDPNGYNRPIEGGILPRFEVFIDGVAVAATKIPSTDPHSTLKLLLSVPTEIDKTVRYKVYANFSGAAAWATYTPNIPATPQTRVSDLIAKANSIVEFDAIANGWKVVFDPESYSGNIPLYITNAKTGIQYKWDGEQWTRSFEGEYRSGMWRFTLP